jgi:hypothetical protein
VTGPSVTGPSSQERARLKPPKREVRRLRRGVASRDEARRVRAENFGLCGVRKVWRRLGREGDGVARRMRRTGLQGLGRGQSVRTTISDKAAPCPLDRARRDVKASAPDRLRVSGVPMSQPGRAWSASPTSSTPMTAFAKRDDVDMAALLAAGVAARVRHDPAPPRRPAETARPHVAWPSPRDGPSGRVDAACAQSGPHSKRDPVSGAPVAKP